VGLVVWGWGVWRPPQTPKPQNPNPQSPIPNPQNPFIYNIEFI